MSTESDILTNEGEINPLEIDLILSELDVLSVTDYKECSKCGKMIKFGNLCFDCFAAKKIIENFSCI
jgi:ribosomal protein L32